MGEAVNGYHDSELGKDAKEMARELGKDNEVGLSDDKWDSGNHEKEVHEEIEIERRYSVAHS